MAMPSTVGRRGPRKAEQIFAATLSLLSERGYDGLTIEGVAAHSGVNKTTIYRWWPSKDALLAAALLDSDLLTMSIPDTGTLRGDLIALAESVSELLTGPQTGAIVAALRAAGTGRKELTELAASLFAARNIREQAIFERAIQRRELPPGTGSKPIADLLEGALWVRLLLRGETPPPNYIAIIVDAVLDGVRPPGRIHLQ
jgi:AcrR family transcriptional regulator